MSRIEESLHTLRDVEGVFGSFVIAGSGTLVARDLPAIFDDEVLAETGPRIMRLLETLGTGSQDLESVMMRYFEHKLYIRKMAWGVIGILSSIRVNLPALRMVGNLVARRIDPEVSATVSRQSLPVPRAMTPAPPRASVAPVPAPRLPSTTPPPPPVTVRTQPPTPPPAAIQVTTAEMPPESVPPTSERQVRMFRGRRIEE